MRHPTHPSASMYAIAVVAGALICVALVGLFTELLSLRELSAVATALVLTILAALSWQGTGA